MGWQSEIGRSSFIEGTPMVSDENLRMVIFYYTFQDPEIPVARFHDIAEARYQQVLNEADCI